MNIILYLIIIGLVLWAVMRELTVMDLRAHIAKLDEFLTTSHAMAEQAIEKCKQRDKLIADQTRFVREMTHMASRAEDWPSEITR